MYENVLGPSPPYPEEKADLIATKSYSLLPSCGRPIYNGSDERAHAERRYHRCGYPYQA
jgi:hypothetical protein